MEFTKYLHPEDTDGRAIRIGTPAFFMTRSDKELLETCEVIKDGCRYTITPAQKARFLELAQRLADMDYVVDYFDNGCNTHGYPMQPMVLSFGESLIATLKPDNFSVIQYNNTRAFSDQLIELEIDNTRFPEDLYPAVR